MFFFKQVKWGDVRTLDQKSRARFIHHINQVWFYFKGPCCRAKLISELICVKEHGGLALNPSVHHPEGACAPSASLSCDNISRWQDSMYFNLVAGFPCRSNTWSISSNVKPPSATHLEGYCATAGGFATWQTTRQFTRNDMQILKNMSVVKGSEHTTLLSHTHTLGRLISLLHQFAF